MINFGIATVKGITIIIKTPNAIDPFLFFDATVPTLACKTHYMRLAA
jgi:hypothetical protein